MVVCLCFVSVGSLFGCYFICPSVSVVSLFLLVSVGSFVSVGSLFGCVLFLLVQFLGLLAHLLACMPACFSVPLHLSVCRSVSTTTNNNINNTNDDDDEDDDNDNKSSNNKNDTIISEKSNNSKINNNQQ